MKKKLYLILSIATLSTMVSCKKEEGCTDKNATNYSESAEKDNGSCSYKGTIVFWYNGSTSEYLYNLSSESLTFYVGGNVVGSTAATQYWTGAPSCGANASITVERDLGTSKSKSYSYEVVDNDGYQVWAGNVEFEANTCTAIQLTP
jgi:hypothetical protein